MVFQHFHLEAMSELIATITDQRFIVAFIITLLGVIVGLVAKKMHTPDSEWRRRYSHPREKAHSH